MIAAGEACSAELAARWGAGRQFCNAYGPTETTVCATINAAVSSDGRKPSIGKAMANMQVYILDAAMQPVPVGVSGELYVGGVGVARGYLNRSDLTAERFVPDPYGPTAGARLYRTGDLARFRGDGEIEYLGRIDNQVKVRGFRIELGEIEAALLSCARVREAAVVAPADADGERRLVAYVVSEGEELSSNELSEYLASQLPQYMLPSAFVMLEQMPLTFSGKLDRRALPAPGATQRSLDVGFVAAETPLQQLLVELWQQTLLVDQVGIHDNFFAIGGDSIRAAIFINKLQQLLGEYLYVVALFDAPTIAQLAAYLEVNYVQAVARWSGADSAHARAADAEPVVDAAHLDQFRSLIPPAPALPAMPAKLGRAVFILSAPRSGSTLLRVMLAGHPRLFAPPELELLGFTTLAERAAELSGRNAFWREGLVRALMQLLHCDAEQAQELTAAWEAEALSVGACYGQLQQWLGERLLVDKTPSYALDLAVLQRAEELFTEPLYVHLVRDPRSMIGSFEEAKLDQVFFRPAHELTRRQLAELIWVTSEQNIAEFLTGVSPERQLRVRYEDLVREPQREAQRLSAFVGLEAVAGMMDPYAEKDER
ncbi:MAG TPA: sulfotransferase, partial [Roseiflexaceae bacterium]|nr:sulfotransferase [Roseiflexaceae bacterium]